MYARNPYPKGSKEADAWETVNHPHGEEYPGANDGAKRILAEAGEEDECDD